MPARLVNTPSAAPLPDVRKIAVLRANGLGDLLFAVPALAALKQTYPGAELTLLGAPMHRELLTSRPGPVDRVVVVPVSRGVRGDERTADDGPALKRFFAEMRDEGFDVAFQLHGGGRYSNPFVQRLGARLTVGMRDKDAPPLDRYLPYVYLQHEVLRYLEVVGMVGARTDGLSPHMAVTDTDVDESLRLVPHQERPLAVVHPGASEPRRRWPASGFAAVADALAGAGAAVVLMGGEDESEVAARVGESMTATAIDTSGRLSIRGLVGLLSRAAVYIGNDSGPLHLARAVGTASVGVYWSANMLNAMPFTRLRHRALASWRTECPVCGVDCFKGRCDHRKSFVADVGVDEVRDEALDVLAAEFQSTQGASAWRSGTVVGSS